MAMSGTMQKTIKTVLRQWIKAGVTADILLDAFSEVQSETRTSEAGDTLSKDLGAGASDGEPATGLAPSNQTKDAMSSARPSRGLAAILSTQPSIQKGLLFIAKTSTGRLWASVGYHELAGMARDGAMAHRIRNFIGTPMDQFATLGDLLTDAQFMEIFNAAQEEQAAIRHGRDGDATIGAGH